MAKQEPTQTNVVSGVIIRRGRILLTQRRAGQDYPFCWEAPGGKVEPGESPSDALRRELNEELGLTLRRTIFTESLLCDFTLKQPEQGRVVWVGMFEIEELNDTPRPLEGQGIGWFTHQEMARLPLAPANAANAHVIGAHIDASQAGMKP